MHKKTPKLFVSSMILGLVCLVAFCGVALLQKQYQLAIVAGGASVILTVFFLITSSRQKKELLAFFQSTTAALELAFKDDVPFPMAILSITSGDMHWCNASFTKITGAKISALHQKFHPFLPDLSLQWLVEGKSESPTPYTIAGRRYRVVGTQILDDQDPCLCSIYLVDETKLLNIQDAYVSSRPVVGVILIDNYDELIAQQTDGAIYNLNGAINVQLSNWVEAHGGLLRKVERNRYLYILESKDFDNIAREKFSVLEDICAVTNGDGLAATISFGIGKGGESYQQNFAQANLAIEMCLSRGGDQAVVKDRLNFTFFGGKTQESQQRTKVKSRVIANSLMELIGQSSLVLIMGHKNADIDAIGAAVGVYSMCRKKDCRAHIVVDPKLNQAQSLLDMMSTAPEYEYAFITPDDAMLMADNRTLLVVVDTNRPDQVESLPLLEAIHRVAVIDHHRRAADYIQRLSLNFHEPSASSASELVSELLFYALSAKEILPLEAQALLAGIVLDTKNFNVRTGSRTFEAAAYLRSCGADTVEVKKLFQNDLKSTISRYDIIRSARLYRGEIAIVALDYTADRTIAAQASDELLNISDISASFVLYPSGDRVMMSARSIGDINVQMVLEPLGGGGNAATAGAQVSGTIHDVLVQLVSSIDRYFES